MGSRISLRVLRMKVRVWVGALASVCALAWVALGPVVVFAAPVPGRLQPPNFLFLFADDQRADTIGAHGNRRIRTPTLDRLTREGFSFRANYCFGSNSGAVCIPSRAMLMSGRTWFRVRHDLSDARSLPEVLRGRGYRTFATGKWHNGRESFARAFERGESVFFGGMADHTQVPVCDLGEEGRWSDTRIAKRYSTEEFAEAALRFLATPADGRPFFAYVAFTTPHDPRNPPGEWRPELARELPPLPRNFLPQHPFDNGQLELRDEVLAPWPRPPQVVREQIAAYYAQIEHMDGQIARILASLAASPHATNTYVIYAADHGLALGSHGLLGKQNLYEHSMRCPLIVRGPGIPAGGRTEAYTYLYDLYPTLLRLAGVEPPGGIDGRDLAVLWSGERETIRETVFLPYLDSMRAIREGRWKLIRYPRVDRTQLFDLDRDADERRDLAAQPRYGPTVERLTRLLEAAQREHGDRSPLRVADPLPAVRDLSGRARKPDQWQPAWIRERYFEDEKSR